MSFATKTPAMQDFLNATAKRFYGRTVTEAMNDHVCVMCGKPVDLDAIPEIDVREYGISGIGPCCFPSEDEA